MSNVHIYTAESQPATRFVNHLSGRAHWFRYPARSLFRCQRCGLKRWAKYVLVQVFYDHLNCWCAPGHGCNREVK
jgi:hypothetical protein